MIQNFYLCNMGKEIERKYLVVDDSFKSMAVRAYNIEQAYLSSDPASTVRVRIAADRGFITVKGRNQGAVRDEWEYEIPLDDAREIITSLCAGRHIVKTRYIVPFEGLNWEIDEFHGHLEGLVVAEIELPSASFVLPPLPGFIGAEVTSDPRYYNSCLINSRPPL